MDKYFLRDYQLEIIFYKDTVTLYLIDPKLIREFYEKLNDGYYIKSPKDILVNTFKFISGNGLGFS